jgi:hypothetical protein
MFALNTMILDQQSFARRDLHDLVHRRSTGAVLRNSKPLSLIGVCILYSFSVSIRFS